MYSVMLSKTLLVQRKNSDKLLHRLEEKRQERTKSQDVAAIFEVDLVCPTIYP